MPFFIHWESQMTMRLNLMDAQFDFRESTLVESSHFKVTALRYLSGVAALRVSTSDLTLEILPFQGQQIWSASTRGRRFSMKSMNAEPVASLNYLEAYGAFFVHCGLTAIGSPGANDRHPLHGELPNARYDEAYIEIGGAFNSPALTIGGVFRYSLAFSTNYRFEPRVTIPAVGTVFDLEVEAANLKASPMELMYLGHANFLPVPGAVLHYSAPYDAAHVLLRSSIPQHLTPNETYLEDLRELGEHPAFHHRMAERPGFDPEVVYSVSYRADESGMAHSLQLLEQGDADYIGFRVKSLPRAIRWVSMTPDQRGLGLALPATSGVEGAAAERAAGRIVEVGPRAVWQANMRLGALPSAEAAAMLATIEKTSGRS
jgi:hypothetical protein